MMIMKFGDEGSYEMALKVMRAIVGSTKELSLIDLCSYTGTITRQMKFKEAVYVDVMDVGHEYEKDGLTFVRTGVNSEHEIFEKRYDVSTCLDGIEHLTKPEGWQMVQRMMKISDIQIIFTPLDAWMIDETATNPEAHKCLWQPEDLPEWGHVVFPTWHRLYSIGGFFSWHSKNMGSEFLRVQAALGRECNRLH